MPNVLRFCGLLHTLVLETETNRIMGLFDRLKAGLKKTKDILRTDVRDLFRAGDTLNDDLLEEFEGRLIRTDMGVTATNRIIHRLREEHGGRKVDVDAVWETIFPGVLD